MSSPQRLPPFQTQKSFEQGKVESNCMEHRPVSAPVAATGRYTSHQHGPQAGPQVGLQGGPQVGLQTGNLAQPNHIQVEEALITNKHQLPKSQHQQLPTSVPKNMNPSPVLTDAHTDKQQPPGTSLNHGKDYRPHSAAAIVHGSHLTATLPVLTPKEMLHSQPYYSHVPIPQANTKDGIKMMSIDNSPTGKLQHRKVSKDLTQNNNNNLQNRPMKAAAMIPKDCSKHQEQVGCLPQPQLVGSSKVAYDLSFDKQAYDPKQQMIDTVTVSAGDELPKHLQIPAPFNNFDEAQPTLQHLHHNQQPQQLQGQPQHHVQQQGVSKTIPLQNRLNNKVHPSMDPLIMPSISRKASLDTPVQVGGGSRKASPRETPERTVQLARTGTAEFLSVDPAPSLHISEEQPLRLRRLSRNHSLKYSGGALHQLNQPNSFDHTFSTPKATISAEGTLPGASHSGASLPGAILPAATLPGVPLPGASLTTGSTNTTTREQNFVKGVSLSPRRSYSEQGNDSAENTPVKQIRARSARKLVRHSSIHNEDDIGRTLSDGVILRSKPLPPLVRIHTEPNDSPRMSRTRGSYSLSRTDRRETANSNTEDEASDGGSERSSSPFGNSLQVCNGPSKVFKSASMSNMSALSNDSTAAAVSEARKRSYLVGSVGPTSLLGVSELEKLFPDRKLRIFIGTWNMNGQVPPRHLAEFLLPANLNYVPDILVVGTQEVFPEKSEWEIRLQDTLGPSHVLFHSASLGTLHLSIFLKRDLIWYCSIPEDDSFSTRPGSQFKTKGAVAVGFIIFGTSLLFVNSHLTAHQENVKDRVRDLKKIYAVLNLPKTLPLKKRRDMFDSFDCVFWCGDLNFRLEQSREDIIRDIEDGVSVLESDQLTWLMSEGTVFRGFREHPISFRPTYKYDPGTDNFDTSSKQRIPSYTDRILYKHQAACRVSPLHYDSVQGVTTSDHKPVWGMFEVVVRPGKDSVPLAGGLFNRQVYLEGLKRRSETLKPHIGKSVNVNNMCVLS